MTVKLYLASISVERYSKSLTLPEIALNLEEYGKYDDYARIAISYFLGEYKLKKDKQIKKIALKNMLNTDDVKSMGEYIRPLLGGEQKESTPNYAGLVFDVLDYDLTKRVYIIRLSNTMSNLQVLDSELIQHWYYLIYRGEIHPFYLNKVFNILLSNNGRKSLQSFIYNLMNNNKGCLSKVDEESILKLIDEIQQPDKLKSLNKNKYYILYRCQRVFSAVTLEPSYLKSLDREIVVSNTVAYLEASSQEVAYYYSGVLNYLAYKAIKSELTFVRDQYARPLHALIEASLSWKDATEIRDTVAKLSEQIHKDAEAMFRGKSFSQEKQYFNELDKNSKFTELVKIVDDYISKTTGHDELIEILSRWVAGKS